MRTKCIIFGEALRIKVKNFKQNLAENYSKSIIIAIRACKFSKNFRESMVADCVNHSFFSNMLKTRGQTLASVFLKILIIAKSKQKCKEMIESLCRVTILGVIYCNFATKLTSYNRKMLIHSTQWRGNNF